MDEPESTPATAPVGGGLFARILMGILGLLLGLLMIAATLYRILAEFGRIDSSDIPDDIVNSLQILQALYYLVAAFCLAVIVSSIATFINFAWARKALFGSIGAMFVLLVGCGIYETSIIEAVFGVYTESEKIHWRWKPMTTFSMLMAYTSLFFGGLIWLIDYLGRGTAAKTTLAGRR